MKRDMVLPIFIASLALNVLFAAAGAVFVYRKGGIGYLIEKVTGTERTTAQDTVTFSTMRSIYDVLDIAQGDIVFIGNSITANCPWHEIFDNCRIRNRGIGAESTIGALKRIDSIARARPSKLFLQLGRSDIVYGAPIPRIAENVRALVTRTREFSPETQIYIQSEIPWFDRVIEGRPFSNETIVELNEALRVVAEKENAEWIDVATQLTAADGQLREEYSFDGVHPNGRGYEVWAEGIVGYVRQR